MTLTELYGSEDLESLNMIMKSEGHNFEFYKEGGEVRWRLLPNPKPPELKKAKKKRR